MREETNTAFCSSLIGYLTIVSPLCACESWKIMCFHYIFVSQALSNYSLYQSRNQFKPLYSLCTMPE